MTSDRSYRKALSKDDALDIMKEESGIKWDPAVVEALFKIVK
jgi:HD-GYP domain-containing protein (c-di-GMP phosphodiesterase class II)